MQEPNWIITSIVGAVIGALLVPTWRIMLYPIRRLRPHPLHGIWYSYSYSFMDGALQLRHGTFTIRSGLLQRWIVHRENFGRYPPPSLGPAPPPLRYRGTVSEEHDHYVMLFSGRTHTETLLYRFVNRIPSNAGIIPGVWMAYDHDLNPAAGCAIISRGPLAPQTVTTLLRSWVVFEKGAFHIRKTPARHAPRQLTDSSLGDAENVEEY
ncbi:hypothetical protein [Longispora albida]|uniref:hypothetical protein n=1 Tax=Longispora albida TaxID=203523 RepID=UPI00036E60BD|nr:hypothetical protein [Longispora albida]